jgi:lysophospholipase
MRTEVEPWLAARRESGFDERIPGEPIYYEHYRADAPKAVVVISHGFTESLEKHLEGIYYLLQAGYEVWGLDHRGHGRSFRANENPLVVYIARFKDYVFDLQHLTETRIVPASQGLPLYLYCHSMGGNIGVRMLELFPGYYRKAVLSSPMLGLSFGNIPLAAALAFAAVRSIGPGGKQPLSPVGAMPEETYEDSASNSEPRFRYYYEKKLAEPRFQTCAAATSWGREAILACGLASQRSKVARIRIPLLLFQAGNDTFVKNEAQDEFAAAAPDCTFVKMPGLKHELFFSEGETLREYWERIFDFYG